MPRDYGIPPGMKLPKDSLEKPKSFKEYPSYLVKKIKNFFTRLFYIVSLVWETSPLVLFALMLFCVLDGVLPIVGAYISRYLMNSIADLIGQSATESIKENVLVILAPVVVILVFDFIYRFLKRVIDRVRTGVTSIAGELLVNHIKLKIINKSKEIDMASFDSPVFYEKLENANREAGMRPLAILTATFNVISGAISVISFIIILLGISPWAPIIIILSAIPGAVVNYYYRNRNYRYMRMHSRERREMNYFSGLMTNKDLVKEVKLLGLGDRIIDKYNTAFQKHYSGLKKLIIRENMWRIFVGLVVTLTHTLLFGLVAYNVIFDGGKIGDYSLYSGALTSVSSHVTAIVSATATIYEGTLFIDNMIDFMKEKPTVVPTVSEPRIPQRGIAHTIELREVSFSYPGTTRKVLENVNLTINSGDRVVLVGLNGAGKTTLIKLLTRLYDPTEGVILLDGYDIREYDVRALYDMFGIIFQDFGKYAVTASENIEFGDVNHTNDREAIIRASESGDSREFIEALPQGFDTGLTRIFEDDGIELSGGQWQKLSVSRAFYKNSDILILDEPTSALDALAEQKVFDQFATLSKGKISIFVSHRLSSAVSASKIVVIENGTVNELGTHEELMALGGTYHKLFSTQAKRYTGA